jgi:anti-sigma factor RsiW
MACESWSEELIDRLAGEISEERAIRLEQHLAECRACTEEMRRLERLVESTRSREEWTADSQLEERLVGTLRRQHAAQASGSWWAALWQRRVPAYAIVGVALMGVIAGMQLNRPSARNDPSAPVGTSIPIPPDRTSPPVAPGRTLQASLPEVEFATTPSDAIWAGRLGSPDSL